MLYDAKTRMLTLSVRDCAWCQGSGLMAGKTDCSPCKGTGNGPRGGKGTCRSCHGYGTQPDFENQITCGRCDGKRTEPETWGDSLPQQALDDTPVIVVRQDREASWNESFLGMNSVFSCVDYGKAWSVSDEETVAEVRRRMGRVNGMTCLRDWKKEPEPVEVSGRTIMYRYDKPSVQMCDVFLVVVSRNGYSVRGAYRDSVAEVLRSASAEPNPHLAMVIGNAVYRKGGNGTLAAAMPLV